MGCDAVMTVMAVMAVMAMMAVMACCMAVFASMLTLCQCFAAAFGTKVLTPGLAYPITTTALRERVYGNAPPIMSR